MFSILVGMWIIQMNAFVETHQLGFEQDSVGKLHLTETLLP